MKLIGGSGNLGHNDSKVVLGRIHDIILFYCANQGKTGVTYGTVEYQEKRANPEYIKKRCLRCIRGLYRIGDG